MKRVLSILLTVILSILVLSSCQKRENAEFEEYRTKVDSVIAYGEALAGAKDVEVSFLDVQDGAFYDKLMEDEDKQVISDYGENYLKITNLAFQLPLICGYSGTEFHGMTDFFDRVFMTEAFTGYKQYIVTSRFGESGYITRIASEGEYSELRLDYKTGTNFSYELISYDLISEKTSYHYGDSRSNYIGFENGRAEIHLEGEMAGYVSFDEDVFSYYLENIDLGTDAETMAGYFTTVLGREECTLSRSDITKAFEDVFNLFIGADEVIDDELGFRHEGTGDTVYRYYGDDTDVLTIPDTYDKLYANFTIHANVKELVIPATVTSIIDDTGSAVPPKYLTLSMIYNDAWQGLERITVEEGSPLFYTKNGDLYEKVSDNLIYFCNYESDTLDLTCKVGDWVDWKLAPLRFESAKNVIVDFNLTRHIYESYIDEHGMFPTLESYTVNGVDAPMIDINEFNYGGSEHGKGEAVLNARTLTFNAKDGDDTFAKISVSCIVPGWDELRYTSNNPEFVLCGTLFDVKELYIDDPNFRFYSDGNRYPNLERIVYAEGISSVSFDGFSGDNTGSIRIELPSTITNLGPDIPENATFAMPYCMAYYNENLRRQMGMLPEIIGTELEKSYADAFREIEYNLGKIRIINIWGNSSDVTVPSVLFGDPVGGILFTDDDLGQRTSFGELRIPNSLTYLSSDTSISIERIVCDRPIAELDLLTISDTITYGEIVFNDGTYVPDESEDSGSDHSQTLSITVAVGDSDVHIYIRDIVVNGDQVAYATIVIDDVNTYYCGEGIGEIKTDDYIYLIGFAPVSETGTLVIHIDISDIFGEALYSGTYQS